MQVKVKTPAKINLTLEVLGKREDGFHDIQSIMQMINLYDYLTIDVEKSEKFEINLAGDNPNIPYNEKNIVCALHFTAYSDAGDGKQRHGFHFRASPAG